MQKEYNIYKYKWKEELVEREVEKLVKRELEELVKREV